MGDRAITYSREFFLKVGHAIVLNVSLKTFDMTTYFVISPTAPTQPACDSVIISLDYCTISTYREQDEEDHLCCCVAL